MPPVTPPPPRARAILGREASGARFRRFKKAFARSSISLFTTVARAIVCRIATPLGLLAVGGKSTGRATRATRSRAIRRASIVQLLRGGLGKAPEDRLDASAGPL